MGNVKGVENRAGFACVQVVVGSFGLDEANEMDRMKGGNQEPQAEGIDDGDRCR